MFKLISATIVMFALTANGFAQEPNKQKKTGPIEPETGKMTFSEDTTNMLRNVGHVVTPNGPRVHFTLNGQDYLVSELIVKVQGQLFAITTNGRGLSARYVANKALVNQQPGIPVLFR